MFFTSPIFFSSNDFITFFFYLLCLWPLFSGHILLGVTNAPLVSIIVSAKGSCDEEAISPTCVFILIKFSGLLVTLATILWLMHEMQKCS